MRKQSSFSEFKAGLPGKKVIEAREYAGGTLRWSDEPNYIVVGRNEVCKCGSGKKYKKCCEEGLFYSRYLQKFFSFIGASLLEEQVACEYICNGFRQLG